MLKTINAYNQLLPLLSDEGLPQVSLVTIIAGCIGFSFRIAYNWSRNILSLKNLIIRLVFAIGLCFLLLIAWQDYNIQHNVVYWIAGFCSMSLEVVNEAVKVMELGIRGYGKKLINYLTARNEQDRNITT